MPHHLPGTRHNQTAPPSPTKGGYWQGRLPMFRAGASASRHCVKARRTPLVSSEGVRTPLTPPAPGASPRISKSGGIPERERPAAHAPRRRGREQHYQRGTSCPTAWLPTGLLVGAKLPGNGRGSRNAMPALGAEGHAAMACRLRWALASGVPRGQPFPWRGTRGAEPARNSAHCAGGTGAGQRPAADVGTTRAERAGAATPRAVPIADTERRWNRSAPPESGNLWPRVISLW